MALVVRLFIFFLCCVSANILASNDWEYSVKTHSSKAFKSIIPRGYFVIHAWGPSPFVVDERSVGHMALQVDDQYVSIWPTEDDRTAENHRFAQDLQELGPSQFLVLKVSDIAWELLRLQVKKFLEAVEKKAYQFHVGDMSIRFPIGNGESITLSSYQDSSYKAESSTNNLEEHLEKKFQNVGMRIRENLNSQGHFGARVGAGTGSTVGAGVGAALGTFIFPGVGTAAVAAAGSALGSTVGAGVGALSGLVDMFSRKMRVNIPEQQSEEDSCKITYQANKRVPNSKTICCVDAVESCLRPISDLYTTVQKNAKKQQTMTHDIQMSLQACFRPFDLWGAMSDSDMKKNIQGIIRKVQLSIIFHNENSKNAFQKAACCVIENGEEKVFAAGDAERLFFDTINQSAEGDDIVKNLLTVKEKVAINKGRAAILFADPYTLPHRSLQNLTYNLYHKQDRLYVTSSFELQFGAPKPVFFKMNQRDTEIENLPEILTSETWSLIDLNDNTYAFLSADGKLLACDENGSLFLDLPHFKENTQFRVTPQSGQLQIVPAFSENYPISIPNVDFCQP